jgi:CRP-like cAMP-binding protein
MTLSPHRVLVQLAGGAYRVPIDVVRYELLKNEAFRTAMITSVADLAMQSTQSALCVAFHPIVPRVARWLLQTRDHSRSSTLEVTQDVVAQMLGVFRQRVSPALMELEAHSLIHQGVGRIHIVNRRGLQALACECYEARTRATLIAPKPAVND